MSDLIQFRKGTAAQWLAANPVLASGEPGFDTTSGGFRIGDGVTAWASLPVAGLADLQTVLDARYLVASVPWVAVSGGVGFLNSWVNFGGGTRDAAYRKVGDIVEVRGLIKSGTVGSPAFTLPAAYWPTANANFATTSNSLFGVLQVTTAGSVTVAVGSNVFASLDPIRYSIL